MNRNLAVLRERDSVLLVKRVQGGHHELEVTPCHNTDCETPSPLVCVSGVEWIWGGCSGFVSYHTVSESKSEKRVRRVEYLKTQQRQTLVTEVNGLYILPLTNWVHLSGYRSTSTLASITEILSVGTKRERFAVFISPSTLGVIHLQIRLNFYFSFS